MMIHKQTKTMFFQKKKMYDVKYRRDLIYNNDNTNDKRIIKKNINLVLNQEKKEEKKIKNHF